LLVHLVLVLLEGWEFGEVVLRYYTVHLGLAELDDALTQIAQVLEQIVVVGVDKVPLRRVSPVETVVMSNVARLTPI
jgi:hypothetical protein